MTKDILSEFGPDAKRGSSPSGHGQVSTRDVHNYQAPKGPTNIGDAKSPGLHGHNCGSGGTQGPYPSHTDGNKGHPGIGGTNHGNSGSQGRR